MGSVTLHFSEDDYNLFRHYCSNYCRLYDDTRKNSIKIFLELYKHQVIDIQTHSLDTVFAFFYQKKQEFETELRSPAGDAHDRMRLRMCTDIISFLEDLEKIYIILKKKGVDVNYLLIIGAFSKIVDEETQIEREDLIESASAEIDAIVSLLKDALEKKLGQEIDIPTLLFELVNFTGTFNRLSTEITFNDEIIDLIAPLLVRRFGKEENDEEIRTLLKFHCEQFEIVELEFALEGGIHAQNEWGLEFSWQELLDPLRNLNELVEKSQSPMRVSLDVLSALEAPMKMHPAQTDYSPLTLYQKPFGVLRKRNDENRFLVKVDNRSHSEVQISAATDFMSLAPSPDYKYKQYFSITAGAMILLLIIVTGFIFSVYSSPMSPNGSVVGNLPGTKNSTVSALSGQDLKPAIVISTPVPPLPRPTLIPTPIPTPQYVTIEPVMPEPDTGPKSNRELFDQLGLSSNVLFNPQDYITIFKNNLSYNLENAYKISFDLKNPPMVIRYQVFSHNITDIKWFEPRDSDKKIDTAIIHRPDESAWFELKIYDNEGLYDQQGWGRLYGIPSTMQEIVIRNEGMYQIEFSGQEVTVNSEVLVKKEGNINI
jgi:hypothetical protein